jgi:hypothetical protein
LHLSIFEQPEKMKRRKFRGSLMTGGAPKWRTIKTVFCLSGSDDLEGGIFQSNWFVWFVHLASGHFVGLFF